MLVTQFDESTVGASFALAQQLRATGLRVDLYPEVYGAKSVGTVRRLLERKKLNPQQVRATLYNLIENGSCYVPERKMLLCFSLLA